MEDEMVAEDVASELDKFVASEDDSAIELELTTRLEENLAELVGVGLNAEARGPFSIQENVQRATVIESKKIKVVDFFCIYSSRWPQIHFKKQNIVVIDCGQ